MLNLVRPHRHIQRQRRRLYVTGVCVLGFIGGIYFFITPPIPDPEPMPLPLVQSLPAATLNEKKVVAATSPDAINPCASAPLLQVQVRAVLLHSFPVHVRLSDDSGRLLMLTPGDVLPNTDWKLSAIQKNSLIWVHSHSGCQQQQPFMVEK